MFVCNDDRKTFVVSVLEVLSKDHSPTYMKSVECERM